MLKPGSRSLVVVALAASTVMAAAKLWVAVVSGSSALLASAVQTLVDASSQALLLHGEQREGAGADAVPARGELQFWSLVAPILLYGLGGGIALGEGATRLLRPDVVAQPTLAYLVLVVSAALTSLVAWSAQADHGRHVDADPDVLRPRSSRTPALAIVVLQNRAGLLGLLIAGLGIASSSLGGVDGADAAAAIAIGLLLALIGARIAVELRAAILATSPPRHVAPTAATTPGPTAPSGQTSDTIPQPTIENRSDTGRKAGKRSKKRSR